MRLIAIVTLVASACATGTGVDASLPAASVSSSPPQSLPTSESAPARVATTTLPLAVSACQGYVEPLAVGTISDPDLDEISGLAVGNGGVIWVHNDSGASSRVWALDQTGAVKGSVVLPVRNIDWEDMSLGPGPGGVSFLYVADIGDNLTRRASVTIHRFKEPAVFDERVEEVDSLVVRYPGDAADAEAFLVDPVTGDSFIVTKTLTGRSSVLRIPAGAWSQGSTEAQRVATIDLGALSFVTSGAITADGSVVALRTYRDVWLWERGVGETVADALRGTPCRAPAASEPQGEAVAFDGFDYLTVSEGIGSAIYRIER